MTQREWLQAAVARLTDAGCEDAAFDARCLLEDLGGLSRGATPGDNPLPPSRQEALETALTQRAEGRPLQYILGQWDFLSLTLSVGEGVLIPRPDTEVLCEAAAARLSGLSAPRVLDLCAGTGCVGLGVASLCPGVRMTAVELSSEALPYLRENLSRYAAYDVTLQVADVLKDYDNFADGWDAILSNPPYIPTAQLPTLQREVQREPALALDGDEDGLRFYRVLATHWSAKLRPGGFLAVEVGFDQAPAVSDLFTAAGLTGVETVPDLAGISRVVIGTK